MVNQTKDFSEGSSYFFTLALADRQSRLLVDEVKLLHLAIRQVKEEHPLDIAAMVVLPEHLHCIWTLPDGDSDNSTRWNRIKAGFLRSLPGAERPHIQKDGADIWQHPLWEHRVTDEKDFVRHVEYIHFNPVKHGHVRHVWEWTYSSFHRYVRQGRYPLDWAGHAETGSGSFGE